MKGKGIWFLLIVIYGISMVGCKKVLMMHYQIKKPKVENSESIQKFITKNNLNEKEHFSFSFEGFKDRINDLGIPGIEIYTKDGKYIPYPGEESCKVGASEFIEILKNPLQFPTSDSLNLHNIIDDLRTIDGKELNIGENFNFNSDFVIVIYWAKFVGKMNSRDIKGWKGNIANNNNSTFETIVVNCDFQEWWGDENLSKVGIKK